MKMPESVFAQTVSGDYVQDQPHLLGTERTGPDLSQEGGEHPDDWHEAHFANPRYVRPESIMPNWAFLGEERIRALMRAHRVTFFDALQAVRAGVAPTFGTSSSP